VNRSTIINTVVAALILLLVASVFMLDGRGAQAPATTTTSSTTTTTVAPTTTTTTTTTTTSTTTTTTTTTEPPEFEEPLGRDLYSVVVVNGTAGGEMLAPMVDQLVELGYARARGLVGAVRAPSTIIYYSADAPGAADRLRSDLGLDNVPIVPIVPIEDAPPVAGRNDVQIMLYLGGA